MFITAFTSSCHLSLSRASSIQSKSHFLKIDINIVFPSTPGSPKWFPSLKFLHQNAVHTSPLPIRATWPAHLNFLDFITRKIFGEQYRSVSWSLCSFLYFPLTLSLLGPNILLSILFSHTLRPTFLFQCERPSVTPIQDNRENYNSVSFPPTCFKLVF